MPLSCRCTTADTLQTSVSLEMLAEASSPRAANDMLLLLLLLLLQQYPVSQVTL